MPKKLLMHRSLLIFCAVTLLLPGWTGIGPGKASASDAEVAPGYKFGHAAPDKQYFFGSLMDVDTDSQGNVYVTDFSNHQVVKLDAGGVVLDTWQGDESFSPKSISVGVADAVYVSNGGSQIEQIDMNNPDSPLLSVGVEQFGYISGIAADRTRGVIYAADEEKNVLWRVDSAAQTAAWSTYVDHDGVAVPFDSLSGVTVADNGDVYVLEEGSRIIQLSPQGEFIKDYRINDYYSIQAVDVDSRGTLYAADNDKNVVLKWDENGLTSTSGGYGTKNLQFDSPNGIAVDDSGILYVADSYNKRVQKLDAGLGHLATWGSLGGGPGEFFYPEGIAVSPGGQVYVADSANNRVQQFDHQLAFIAEQGNPEDPKSFVPYGMASDSSGNIYITGYSQLYKYYADTGATELIAGSFGEPRGVAIDSAGAIYVADTGGHQVVKLDVSGERMTSWEGEAEENNWYFRPQGIAVDSARGIVYVSDATKIQTFTVDGAPLVSDWGEPEKGAFSYIRGLALDSAGNLYVADGSANRIEKFAPGGSLLTAWGEPGSGEGQTNEVAGVAVDSTGNVYITDSYNHRIQKFAFDLNHLSGLTVSSGKLNQEFDPQITEYSVSVANSVDEITLSPEALHDGAMIEVNGEVVASSTDSSPISLSGESTEAAIEVTATDGQKRTYTLQISRAAAEDSALSPDTVAFDKNTASQADISIGLTLNGNTLTSIKNGTAVLAENEDYLLEGTKVIFPKAYLAALPLGATSLEFTFSAGLPQTLAITVSDTTEPEVTPAPTATPEVTETPAPEVTPTATPEVTERPASEVTPTPSPEVPTSNPAVATGRQEEVRQAEAITGESNNTVKINIMRKRTADGRKTDIVSLDEFSILELAKKAAEGSRKTARIVISDLPKDPADLVTVNLSRKAVSVLDDYHVNLEIETGNSVILLSKETVALLKTDARELIFNIKPVQTSQELAEVSSRVLNSQEVLAAAPGKAEVVGKPVQIEANYAGKETKLAFPLKNITLPSDPVQLELFLQSLAVYVEHSDGEKVLQRGTIVYDAIGKPASYEISVNKFSTFTLVNLHDAVIYEGYINGSAEGLFNPGQSITRAELAAMLARQMSPGEELPGTGFTDVSGTHWAAASITLMKNAGMMTGDQQGLFHPDSAVTRAEMARIIVNWKKLRTTGEVDTLFTDTKGHWASGAIAAVAEGKWMSGYPDGSFAPAKPLTRAEAVTVLNRLLGRPLLDDTSKASWKDVPPSYWAYADIEAASRTFVSRP